MKIIRADHVALAVPELEGSLPLWENLLGVKALPVEDLPERGVRAARLEPPGGTAVELVAPLGEDSPIRGFLSTRGAGLHHVCLEVEDIISAMAELKSRGFRFVGEGAATGAHGCRIAFLHPKSCGGVLLEIMDRKGPAVRSDGGRPAS